MARWKRREVLGAAAAGGLGFLAKLQPVSAEDVAVKPEHVRLRPEIEPLVRLLEETPRERVLEEVGASVKKGTSYTQLLAALQLAGVRNIRPRPVGFKFHAVLVVNSAHLASLASAPEDRWLPLFWAVDTFKSSQAQDVKEGDWTMAAVRDAALPPPDQARARFIEAMDRWDEAGADVAAAQLGRTGKPEDVWELFWRYGARDFRDIGHKAIYAANAWRTLKVIGWEHAEPIVRSLAYACLEKGGAQGNPADLDDPADRPWRRNLGLVKELHAAGPGQPHPKATVELLSALRAGSPEQAAGEVVRLLNRGVAERSLWDGVFLAAGELLMRQPGIVGIHCVTSANALHFGSQATRSEETRRMLLLQAASFMPLFRAAMEGRGKLRDARLEALEPAGAPKEGAVADIFREVSRDRMAAAAKTLDYLQAGGSAAELMAAARRLIFLKGTDSHDYKFSSAALEDFGGIAPEWRNRFLASAMFNLEGSGARDNPLVARTRAALG
jgi:hypothetical protein